MKNKVICPDCGHVYDIKDFLGILDGYCEEETEVVCPSCFESIEISCKRISYQSYEIELCAKSSSVKYFTVMSCNTQEGNTLEVGFKDYNWVDQKKVEKELKKGEFKKIVTELKKGLVEAALEHYEKHINKFLKIKEGLK